MRESLIETVKKRLKLANPHWETGEVDIALRKDRKRRYFDLFFPIVQSKVKRAVVLMGPRRVGKTVILWQTIQELIENGHPPQKIFYASLDTPILYPYSLEELLKVYKETFKLKSLSDTIIIFDEIQYLKKWDVQLKVLVDTFESTKFIASGSAASALKRKSLESGAGRFTDFLLPPLTFYEYLDLQGLVNSLIQFVSGRDYPVYPKNIDNLNQEFINYLNYGGFPEAIFDKSIQENPQRFVRSDIIDKVLLRDLPSLYGIPDTQELNRLFSALAYQTGSEISYEKLSQSSGIAKNTIKKYIDYLEAAFLIRTVKRIDDSGKTFQRKNFFKVYLTNPSMYSATYELISEEDSQTLGRLVETAIFSQWTHDHSQLRGIYYVRWSGGKGEVDLIKFDKKNKIKFCVEVKWSDRYIDNIDALGSLINFCEKNKVYYAYITTKSKSVFKSYKNIDFDFIESSILCFCIGYLIINQKIDSMKNLTDQGPEL